MTDRAVAVTAVVAALVALVSGAVPTVALSTGVVVAGVVAAFGFHRRADRRNHGVAPGVALSILLVAVVGLRAQQDLDGLAEELPARIEGIAELGGDPERTDFGAQVELILDGRRYLASVAREQETAVLSLRVGDHLRVEASVRRFRGAPQGWLRSRHLAGRLTLNAAEPIAGTRPWYRAANGMHSILERGAASMSEEHRALYLGLVVGDDRGQDDYTGFRFRASGLTHLLAVSGQNLAFVLVALSPLTARVTFRWRWLLGAAAIVGFVLVTRAEPSVMRAAVMAVLGLTAAATGRGASGVRVLGLAIILLLIGDPMLVESVGFRLSVAATAGLVLLTRPIGRRLAGPAWLTRPLAVTLAAQVGAVPVLTLTFGAVSVLAVPANLVAGPAAGAVMTLGMTSGLVAGLVREELAVAIQVPVRAAVWWVDAVATVVADMSAPPVDLLGWAATLGAALAAASLWRLRGGAAVGRVTLMALVPGLVLTRPPTPDPLGTTTHRIVVPRAAEPGPAALVGFCGQWAIELGESRLDERTAVGVLEGLWAVGLRKVAVVHTSATDGAAPKLAQWLHATLVVSTAAPRARGSPCAG